jgi:hypothetical protein
MNILPFNCIKFGRDYAAPLPLFGNRLAWNPQLIQKPSTVTSSDVRTKYTALPFSGTALEAIALSTRAVMWLRFRDLPRE